MKKKTNAMALALAFTMVAAVAKGVPSPNTYHGVTNDWYNANFSNVLELAEARLAANSNDIVGVTLKLGYDVSFGDIATLSNSVARFIDVADTVCAPSFSNEYWAVRSEEIRFRDVFIPTLTPAAVEAERHKALLPHKPIPERRYLMLLWRDGLWTPLGE